MAPEADNINMSDRSTNRLRAHHDVDFVDSMFEGESFLNIHGMRIIRANGEIEELEFDVPNKNLIVNEGRNHVRDVVFRSGTQIPLWYIGILSATPTIAATDTAAQIGGTNGWSEVTDYNEATRPEFVDAATGVGQIDNVASVASFTINANVTVGGAFVISNNVKGGLTGVLMCAVPFTSGNRALIINDVLEVTYTVSNADDAA